MINVKTALCLDLGRSNFKLFSYILVINEIFSELAPCNGSKNVDLVGAFWLQPFEKV